MNDTDAPRTDAETIRAAADLLLELSGAGFVPFEYEDDAASLGADLSAIAERLSNT